jgi:hypothetical protein
MFFLGHTLPAVSRKNQKHLKAKKEMNHEQGLHQQAPRLRDLMKMAPH